MESRPLRPKEFPFIVLEPGAEILLMSVVYRLEAVAEFQRKLCEVLTKHKVKVLRAYRQKLPEAVELVLFVDAAGIPGVEALLDDFRKVEGVVSVERFGPERDILVDLLHFPLTSRGGVRMIIFSAEMLSKGLTELYKTFGTGANFILYKLGFDYGKGLASHFKRMMASIRGGVEIPLKRVVEIFLEYLVSAGWCILEGWGVSTEEKVKAQVRVKDLWEALNRKQEKLEEGGCDLFRGLLTGFFSDLYGVKFKSVEVSCEARGSPYCEFHVIEQD